jgi:hypothetical protein
VYLVEVRVVVSNGIDALLEFLGGEIAIGVSAGQRLDGMLLGLDLALNGMTGLPWLRSNDLGFALGEGDRRREGIRKVRARAEGGL